MIHEPLEGINTFNAATETPVISFFQDAFDRVINQCSSLPFSKHQRCVRLQIRCKMFALLAMSMVFNC